MNLIREKSEKILCGAVFTLYVLITTYKLTNASLWFDETVEYWYSKVMFGALPFNGEGLDATVTNMYQRMVSTFQPPLYNVVMHFWLKLGDSEWWFGFFGVVIGFVGMIALYKTICKIGNAYLASLAVAFSTYIYQLVYYWQECGEYCLMLGTLFWTIYFWFCLMENPSRKNIIAFTVSAVIPVYSQYGAAFPIAIMALSTFIYVLFLKDREKIVTIIISDAVALIFAALPLYFFFIRKQLVYQQERKGMTIQGMQFSDGVLADVFHSFQAVFKWNFFSYYSDLFVTVFLIVFFVLIVLIIIFSHNKIVKLFIGINVAVWIMYYLSVKCGIYAYGDFENRYNLFFIPMWITMIFAMAIEVYKILPAKLKWQYVGISLCFLLCFSYYAWTAKLQSNWGGKENNREVVAAWYAADAADSNTIVYYAGDSGFAYYVRQNDEYTATTESNVIYMDWYRDKSIDEYREYIHSVYGDSEDWPDEIYIVASHVVDDFESFLSSITSVGYDRENIYSTNAYLIRLTRTAELDSLLE